MQQIKEKKNLPQYLRLCMMVAEALHASLELWIWLMKWTWFLSKSKIFLNLPKTMSVASGQLCLLTFASDSLSFLIESFKSLIDLLGFTSLGTGSWELLSSFRTVDTTCFTVWSFLSATLFRVLLILILLSFLNFFILWRKKELSRFFKKISCKTKCQPC